MDFGVITVADRRDKIRFPARALKIISSSFALSKPDIGQLIIKFHVLRDDNGGGSVFHLLHVRTHQSGQQLFFLAWRTNEKKARLRSDTSTFLDARMK